MVTIKSNNKKKYSIEKRVFKDSKWYNAWFSGIKNEWDEWEQFSDSDDINSIHKLEKALNESKKWFKYKVEYRLIKNESK